tara:strand:+ start:27 stop:494 length:468 start_codon:yes stop_codon:yes gene_type:complete
MSRPLGEIQQTEVYWEEQDKSDLAQVQSIADMTAVALRVLKRMPAPVGEVCGPISNGGVGSIAGNLKVFSDTIQRLQQRGHAIFDQMPFEEYVHRIVSDEYNVGTKLDLLEGFYAPLFESGNLHTLYFIAGWESSNGARWERAKGVELGLTIVDL